MTKYLDSKFDFENPDVVEGLDELPLWSVPFGLRLLEKVHYKKHITALDIGFGTGFPLIELAMRLGETARVYGIDIWKTAILRAEWKIKQYGIKNIQILEGEAESIPLKDESIDLVVSNNGINNVTNIGQVLSECNRILKTGAQFIMTMNLDSSMRKFYDIYEELLQKNNFSNEVQRLKEHIYAKRKPLQEIEDLLKRNGLIIKDIVHDKFEYRFADGSSMLNHHFIKLAFLDSWKEIVPQANQKQVFSELERIMNDDARKKGVLSLSIPFVTIDCIKAN